MTIWILALLCVAIAGYAGFARGVIRVAMSLVGILVGLICAPIFGPMLAPVMRMGINNALLADAMSPFVVFLLITIAFKLGAQAVHNKVEVHFKYKESDTRLLHWQRVMARSGAGLGIVNGTLYFYVLCTLFYVAGYLSTQVTDEESANIGTKIVNTVAADVNASGMDKAIVAIDPMADTSYYDAADVLGLLHHNKLLLSRLLRYPAFLGLAETPEAQDIGGDVEVQQLIQTGTVLEVITNPKVKAFMENPSIVDTIKDVDMADLKTYLETNESPKYQDTKILGRWDFDQELSINQSSILNPTMKSRERQAMQAILALSFNNGTFTATPDGEAFIKASRPPALPQPGQVPPPYQPGPPERMLYGNWSENGGTYTVSLPNADSHPYYQGFKGDAKVRFLNNNVFLEFDGMVLAFKTGP